MTKCAMAESYHKSYHNIIWSMWKQSVILTFMALDLFIAIILNWKMGWGWWYCELLVFLSLLAQHESSLLVCMVSHIRCWCGVFFMLLLVLVRDGNSLCTGAVGPFLVLYLVLVLRYVYAWFLVHAWKGCAAFHVVYMLFINNYVWKWNMTILILSAWHPIHWRRCFVLTLLKSATHRKTPSHTQNDTNMPFIEVNYIFSSWYYINVLMWVPEYSLTVKY